MGKIFIFKNFRNKADLSLNTIVVAAIVLIVLIVLVIIFAGRMGLFRQGMNSCEGSCVKTTAECQGEDQMPVYTINCKDSGTKTAGASGSYCCIKRS